MKYAAGLFVAFACSGALASGPDFALRFDGVDDYVSLPPNPDLQLVQSDFTIEMWIFANAFTDSYPLTGLGWGGGNEFGYSITIGGGKLHLDFEDEAGNDINCLSQATLSDAHWHHIAMVRSSSTVSLYVDGQYDSSATQSMTYVGLVDEVRIGKRAHLNNNSPFMGVVDEVRLWHHARTADQIRQFMNMSLDGTEPGLAAYWTFDDSNGQTLTDHTGRGNDGRLGDTSQTDSVDPTWVISTWPTCSDVDGDGYSTCSTPIPDCNDANPSVHPGAVDLCNGTDDNCDGTTDQGCSCAPVPDGIVGWWPAEGNAQDVEGADNGVVQNGIAFAPGFVGQAFSSDGVDDHVNVSDSARIFFANDQPFTVELWFQPTAESSSFVVLKNAAYGIRWQGSASPLAFYNGNYHYSAKTTWSLGQWYHVAMVDDGTASLKLYVNGVLNKSDDGSLRNANRFACHPSGAYCFPFQFGGVYETHDVEYFNGKIDEIALYARALDASEVQSIFVAGDRGKCEIDEDGDGLRPPYDCDDTNAAVHPAAVEICDGIDNNCNGQVDDNLPVQTLYRDADGDSYGNAGVSQSSCSSPPGWVSQAGDCDDARASVHPGATEVCNGVDDDCDGATNCEDDNPCTNEELCVGAAQCTYFNNTASCDDGNPCTTADRCTAGACAGGPAQRCTEDGNACTADVCDPSSGCVATDANMDDTPGFSQARVDGRDLVLLADAWNSCLGHADGRYNLAADLDPAVTPEGACVNEDDFHQFMNAFGRSCL